MRLLAALGFAVGLAWAGDVSAEGMSAAELRIHCGRSDDANYFLCSGYIVGVIDAWDGVTPPLLADRRHLGALLPLTRFCVPTALEPAMLVTLVKKYLDANVAMETHTRADEAVRRAMAESFKCR